MNEATPGRPRTAYETRHGNSIGPFNLANSTVTVGITPAGLIATVNHLRRDRHEYAGPLPEETVEALEEVSA
jgi:hypothetical protein